MNALFVQHNPHRQEDSSDDRAITPLHVRLEADRSPSFTSTRSSTSDPTTVLRWQTPPSRIRTPERSTETIRPATDYRNSIGANNAAYASDTPLVREVRFDEEQIRSNEAEASLKELRMDALSLETSPPTPVDDTPYIRFAIDQLTRDEELRITQRPSTAASTDSYPVERIVPDNGLGYVDKNERRNMLALIRKHRSSPGEGRLFNFNATRPLSYSTTAPAPVVQGPAAKRLSKPEIFIPVDPPENAPRYPDLTFVPAILRPISMTTLSCLCLLMIAALIFCAIYPVNHNGLVAWSGGIYGGLYFVFGFLPQILAACIFIYVQCVMSASMRLAPYTLMATDDVGSRENALFIGIYPRTMLWPRWGGPIGIDIANTLFWFSVFTIPLHSCLFSVVRFDGEWRWTTVRAVAWTLVALYVCMLLASVFTGLFFVQRTTGLKWDPRSLADVIAMLPRSNVLRDYPGTDVMRCKEDIRHRLRLRSDRLGYWNTPAKNQGVFYCIGEEGASTRQYTLSAGKLYEKSANVNADMETAERYNTTTRFRFLPWFLRDSFLVFWCVAGFIFLLALFILSFLPSTSIRKGFPPQVPVIPNSAGFSAANFLYSFIPSLLGMLLYLFYLPLDMAIRKLQPWTALGRTEGCTADESLLLDYPFSAPMSCSAKALQNGHYLVAATSFFSMFFLVLPILAGGIFFPLTTPHNGVRLIPNTTAYYIVLAILVIYLAALIILIPNRRSKYLPHDVDCLAEILSFVHDSQVLDDAAFRAPKSKWDLQTRLMATKGRAQEVDRYAFGVHVGRSGRECLGIEKLGRREQEVLVLAPQKKARLSL